MAIPVHVPNCHCDWPGTGSVLHMFRKGSIAHPQKYADGITVGICHRQVQFLVPVEIGGCKREGMQTRRIVHMPLKRARGGVSKKDTYSIVDVIRRRQIEVPVAVKIPRHYGE